MVQKMLRVSAVLLLTISSSAVVGSQNRDRNDPVLKKLLSSSLFRDVSAMMIPCELTAYCAGSCCNTGIVSNADGSVRTVNWENKIAAGNCSIDQLRGAGIEIAAVDQTLIPFGSIIEYNGKYYAALDCGGLIKGRKIDLSMSSHSAANDFGRRFGQAVKVYVPSNPPLSVKTILSLCL